MMKIVVIGTTALFLTASSIANAQTSQTSSPADSSGTVKCSRPEYADGHAD